jgi:hypothetical protein
VGGPRLRRRPRPRQTIGWPGLVLGVLGVLAILLYLRPGLRAAVVSLVGVERAAPSPAPSFPPASPVGPPAAPLAFDASAQPATSSAATPAPPTRPTAVEGIDAAGWRERLRVAAAAGDATEGAKALLALAEIDPAALAERGLVKDAGAIAVLLELRGGASADRVFELLASAELASVGPDVLYQMTTLFGGSKGAARAKELLSRNEVTRRASPALQIALQLRDAPCGKRRELLARVGAQGDQRSLALLQTMQPPACDEGGGCCLSRDPSYAGTVLQLQQRLASEGSP